jgi:hypothetical protein
MRKAAEVVCPAGLGRTCIARLLLADARPGEPAELSPVILHFARIPANEKSRDCALRLDTFLNRLDTVFSPPGFILARERADVAGPIWASHRSVSVLGFPSELWFSWIKPKWPAKPEIPDGPLDQTFLDVRPSLPWPSAERFWTFLVRPLASAFRADSCSVKAM